MDIPESVLISTFNKALMPGNIFWTDHIFAGSITIKRKIFIILSKNNNKTILTAKVTSKIKKNRYTKFDVFVPIDKNSPFKKPTQIRMVELECFDTDVLRNEYLNKKLDFLNPLPAEILYQVYNMILINPLIKRKNKKRLQKEFNL